MDIKISQNGGQKGKGVRGRGERKRGGGEWEKGVVCNTQRAALLPVHTLKAPFRINKILCKEGEAGWGCICALRAAAAGPARQASQKGVSVSISPQLQM